MIREERRVGEWEKGRKRRGEKGEKGRKKKKGRNLTFLSLPF